ncbi:hypothetical protein F4824DRAFT_500189 [Ustulina deusta]|nr:hypothetical protein F4824DRAFT_500189 [Ustulina deusta]
MLQMVLAPELEHLNLQPFQPVVQDSESEQQEVGLENSLAEDGLIGEGPAADVLAEVDLGVLVGADVLVDLGVLAGVDVLAEAELGVLAGVGVLVGNGVLVEVDLGVLVGVGALLEAGVLLEVDVLVEVDLGALAGVDVLVEVDLGALAGVELGVLLEAGVLLEVDVLVGVGVLVDLGALAGVAVLAGVDMGDEVVAEAVVVFSLAGAAAPSARTDVEERCPGRHESVQVRSEHELVEDESHLYRGCSQFEHRHQEGLP